MENKHLSNDFDSRRATIYSKYIDRLSDGEKSDEYYTALYKIEKEDLYNEFDQLLKDGYGVSDNTIEMAHAIENVYASDGVTSFGVVEMVVLDLLNYLKREKCNSTHECTCTVGKEFKW